mmetsp:Transcript_125886/g.367820  ORF Transcript_125886/g.367820 Transcript_125886/m.367820 type:complete len:237 (-) Transcript_125886:71-781(-)
MSANLRVTSLSCEMSSDTLGSSLNLIALTVVFLNDLPRLMAALISNRESPRTIMFTSESGGIFLRTSTNAHLFHLPNCPGKRFSYTLRADTISTCGSNDKSSGMYSAALLSTQPESALVTMKVRPDRSASSMSPAAAWPRLRSWPWTCFGRARPCISKFSMKLVQSSVSSQSKMEIVSWLGGRWRRDTQTRSYASARRKAKRQSPCVSSGGSVGAWADTASTGASATPAFSARCGA